MPILILLASYLIGSFPTAYVAGRILGGKDIRRLGDGNVGAANAYRELGPPVGIAVFVIDVVKGLAVIALSRASGVSNAVVLWSGVMVVLGHSFPVFLRFRGGRGEAAAIGALIGVLGWPAVIATTAGIACLPLFKQVTPASAVGFVMLPVLCWVYGYSGGMIFYSVCLPIQVGVTHFLRVHAPRMLRPA
jgi:glycerol-3-phosphate acyltransferase PlsY